MTQKCPGRTSGWFKCVILMQPWRSQDQHGGEAEILQPGQPLLQPIQSLLPFGFQGGLGWDDFFGPAIRLPRLVALAPRSRASPRLR